MIQSVLYGNGINRLTQGMPSWNELIASLFRVQLDGQIPNPLKYEALLMNKPYREPPHSLLDCDGQSIIAKDGMPLNVLGEYTEKALQNRIVDSLSSFQTNQIYNDISDLPVSHFITTNYDNSIFKSFDGGAIKARDNSEKKYSLRRNYLIDNPQRGQQHYWPIHGNIDTSSSIMLGFDHYCGSLVKVESFVSGKEVYQGNRVESIKKRLSIGISEPLTWIDLFFISDVHIIGLGLNYEEMDLWWVLNKRRRIKWEDPKLINNKIYYYQVDELTESQNKVFSSFDINVVFLDPVLLSKEEFMQRYEAQITAIKDNMSKRR